MARATRQPPDATIPGAQSTFTWEVILRLDGNSAFLETHVSDASIDEDGRVQMKLTWSIGMTPDDPLEIVATKEAVVDPLTGEIIGEVIDQGEWDDKEYVPTRWNGEWVWTHVVPPIDGVFTDRPARGIGGNDHWILYI